MQYPTVNAHLHTPYSFSAFSSITEALDKAALENVQVAGINDFYTMEGYAEWNNEARKRHIHPLFNIELISLQEEDQKAGIRVNDPNNPGRTYISGKALKCPPSLPEPYASSLAAVRHESDAQVSAMCSKLNNELNKHNAGFTLNYQQIKQNLAKGSVRERHLAKALRIATYEHHHNNPAQIPAFLQKLFSGKPLKAGIDNHAAVENEIRANLLKAGGAAFVPEDPKAFLPLHEVRQIILAAGGIPTYPLLGDDPDGKFTEFEQDIRKTAETLRRRGIHSVEFITTRNSIETLETCAGYLSRSGFAVTFGTEHNTPAMEPVEPFARGGAPLTALLKQINYEGACILAAHQALVKQGKPGYLDPEGNPDPSNREKLIKTGDREIKNTTQNKY
jgi:hypothetical protein